MAIAPEYYNNNLHAEGWIAMGNVPNAPGTVLTYDPVNKKISTRTNGQIVADLNLMTDNTTQTIYGQKNYVSYSGGNWYNNTLVAYSDGSANPAISFFKKGIDAAQLVFDGGTFNFFDSVSNNYVPVKANGFRKNSLTDDYFLLAGGGHVLKTDVALTHTHTYLENKNYDQLADLNTYLEAGRMKYQPAVLQGSPNLFPTSNNANGILSVATWKDKAFGHDLGFSSNGHLYHRYKGDGTQYGWDKVLTDAGPDGVVLSRGNVFKDNSDANNFPALSDVISVELPNGSGNVNFPFNDYGTFTRIRSNSFITDFLHRHNGDLYHRNWYAFSNAANYPFRKILDNYNFNPDNYITLDRGIKVDIQGGINNGSASRGNTAWFDYNWAGTGGAGSVLNFSGLPGGKYNVELFAEYQDNGANHIGYRVYNGDNNTWGLHKWFWHTDNFNPDSKVNKSGDTMLGPLVLKNLNSPSMAGGQIINAGNANELYFGNPSVSSIYIESGDSNLLHNRANYGVGVIWDAHNFNPNSKADVSTLSNYVSLDNEQTINGLKTINRWQGNYGTGWNLVKDKHPYSLLFGMGQGSSPTDNYGTAIGFYNEASLGVQASIIVRNNGMTGTSMGFTTTDSFVGGPQLALSISPTGKANFERQLPSFQNKDLATQEWVSGNYQPAGSYIKNGGQNTTSNNIFLGWTGSELQLTVDATVIGNFATQNWVSTNYQPAGNYATQTWVSANYAAKNHTHPEYQPAGNYVTQSGLDSQLLNYATQNWVSSNFATQGWVSSNFISDQNLTKEIKVENSEVRLTPFDLIVYSNFNMFDTDNRLVYVTLSDGGDIVMKNIFRFQNITIMNTSSKFGVFKVENTNIAIEIESHTTMNAYVNGDGRLINISAGTAKIF